MSPKAVRSRLRVLMVDLVYYVKGMKHNSPIENREIAAVSTVAYRAEAGIAVLTIDNPPVNAMSMAVRAELLAAVQRAARRRGGAGDRRHRRQRPLHPRRRHQGVRQADHRAERPRRHRGDRGRRQAGRRRAGRQRARRRAGDRARLPLARRDARCQARPARSEHRAAARRRRHAAPAAPGRRRRGARHDHERQADRRPQARSNSVWSTR